MTEGKISGHLLAFAFPLMIENLFQTLYNIVSSVIVGQFIGKQALAAVGCTGTIINLFTVVFMGFSTGITTVAAQEYGAKQYDDFKKTVRNAFPLLLIVGGVVTTAALLLVPTMLRFTHTPDDIFADAATYLYIYFTALPAVAFFNSGSGLLRASGNSRRPVVILIISSISNIIMALIFVGIFKMGIVGAALAAVLAQYVSAALALLSFVKTKEFYHCLPREYRLDGETLHRITYISMPQVIERIITYFFNVVVQSYINVFGSTFIAGYSAYGKVESMLYLVMTSMSSATLIFSAQNAGAGKYSRLQAGGRISALLSSSFILGGGVFLILFRYPLMQMFNDDPEVIAYGAQFFVYITPLYVLMCIYNTYGNLMKGVGDVVPVTFMLMGGLVAARWVYLYFGTRYIMNTPMFVVYAMPFGWFVTMLLMMGYYATGHWKKKLGFDRRAKLADQSPESSVEP